MTFRPGAVGILRRSPTRRGEQFNRPDAKCISGSLPKCTNGLSSPMSTVSAERPARLRLLTFPSELPEHAIRVPSFDGCTGGYTCECPSHTAEREDAVRRGVRKTRGNPLSPRPARRAA